MRYLRCRLNRVLVAGLVCLAIGCGAQEQAFDKVTSTLPGDDAAAAVEAPVDSSMEQNSGGRSEDISPEPVDSFDSVAADDSTFESLPSIPEVTVIEPIVEDEPVVIEPLPEESPRSATVGGTTHGANGGYTTKSQSRPRIKGGTFPSPRNWQPPGVSFSTKSESKPPVENNTVETLADAEAEPLAEEIPVIEPLHSDPGPVETTAAAPLEESPIAEVDKLVSKLKSGNVAYNAPDSMHYKETRVMELLLSPKESPALLEAQLADRRNAVSEPVQHVAPRMEAALTGKGFEIESLDPEIQFVSSLRPTRWRWRVTPNSHGQQELSFSLDAHLDLGGDGVYSIRSFDKVINVEITLREQVTEYVTANWQWLWGTLILPVVGLRMKYRRKRRRDDDWDDREPYDDRDRLAA